MVCMGLGPSVWSSTDETEKGGYVTGRISWEIRSRLQLPLGLNSVKFSGLKASRFREMPRTVQVSLALVS
jgi:hypothetical protein